MQSFSEMFSRVQNGRVPVMGGFIGVDPHGYHHHDRPRRLRFFRGHRRRRTGRGADRDLDRRGRNILHLYDIGGGRALASRCALV